MEDIIDDINYTPTITEDELFSAIWKKPRLAFRFIIDNNYSKHVVLLLILSGISSAFERASMRDMGDTFSLPAIIGISIAAGGLFGWISTYFYSGLISWTGKWLKGTADTSTILHVLAYAMIPTIISLIFLIPQFATYGVEVYKKDGDIISGGLIINIIFWSSMAAELVLGCWTIYLCVIGISELQQFTIGKAVLNLLLPVLLIVIPILLIALLFM